MPERNRASWDTLCLMQGYHREVDNTSKLGVVSFGFRQSS